MERTTKKPKPDREQEEADVTSVAGSVEPSQIERAVNVGVKDSRVIATGGGAYVGGGVQVTGGDFVGRDQVVHGDKVHGVGGDELAKLFKEIYKQIEERPEDPDVDKEELAETVEKVEKEAAKGEKANPTKVERWLKFLGGMAPDILKVTAAALANPVAGVGTAIGLIAEKARAEAEAEAG